MSHKSSVEVDWDRLAWCGDWVLSANVRRQSAPLQAPSSYHANTHDPVIKHLSDACLVIQQESADEEKTNFDLISLRIGGGRRDEAYGKVATRAFRRAYPTIVAHLFVKCLLYRLLETRV